MGPEMKLFVEVAAGILEIPAPVIEVGAFQIAEGVHGDLKPYLPKPYIGIDMRSGPGVNLVGNFECLPLKNTSVGTLLAVATLEHVANPIRAFDEMYRVAKRFGLVIVTSLFSFPIHAYPNDFWRFTPEGFVLLLDQFTHRIICSLGRIRNPTWVMGIGFKSSDIGDATHYEAKAKLLHEIYLQKLSSLGTSSLKTDILGKVQMLPGFRRFHTLSPRDLGLAVAKGMELTTTIYSDRSICRQLQTRLE